MDRPEESVRPETLALGALIEATIERVAVNESKRRSDGMLFLGNRHTAFPVLVVQDPVLEPVDKLVWMTIMLQAQATGGYTAFPSYDYIRKTANIASKSTVARSIAVLRATRWLTLCARVRERSGRFRGNVFALHDEPLPLVDVLHLDTGYMQFLRNAQNNVHARVRLVTSGVLATLDADIRDGVDVCAGDHPASRRMEAVETIANDGAGRFFAFSAQAVNALRGTQSGKHPGVGRVLESSVVTSNPAGSDDPVTGADGAPLIYPKRLGDNQRELSNRYLASVLPEQRQPILDELEGRFRSEEKGMRPLYDEMSFLNSLCKAMRNGEFKLNLGARVQAERTAREKARERRRPGPRCPPDPRKLRDRIEAGTEAFSKIRRSLGLPDHTAPELPDET